MKNVRSNWQWILAIFFATVGITVLNWGGVPQFALAGGPPPPLCNGTPYDPSSQGCCCSTIYNLSTDKCEIKVKMRPSVNPSAGWQDGSASIAAGGKGSAVHVASVRLEVTPAFANRSVTVKLDGGNGFDPSKSWWSPDGNATKAALSIGGQTISPGETKTVTLSGTSMEGSLSSSNAPESASFTVKLCEGASGSGTGTFERTTYENDVASQGYIVGTPTTVHFNATYGGFPVDSHNLKLFVKTVTLQDNTVKQTRPGDGYLYDLSGYVKVGSSYTQDAATDSSGVAAGTVTVVDGNVKSFEIDAGDMSVAVPN